jgi:hypothetical protein
MSISTALKDYYKKYCKILTRIIHSAKKMHHEKEISQLTNKTKAAWNVIRSLMNKRVDSNEELILNYK